MTFADRAIQYNQQLTYTGETLPEGIRIMNPFKEIPGTMAIVDAFYHKYYNDDRQRYIILGINPGRFGGGLTGIPFTDPKRLVSECGIPYSGLISHEPSSVFIYEMIAAYGGVEAFYKDIYINSPCPLGFTSMDQRGKETNYNYYDSKALEDAVKGFMIENIHAQIALGINTDICFCLGTGKNEKALRKLNNEHPRYIMQYKFKEKQFYIDKYVTALKSI